MSDTDTSISSAPASSSGTPNDPTIEQGLRDAVATICDSGHFDELTVNGVRSLAQANMVLREGFFKDAKWKGRSKRIIEEEVERHNEAGQGSSPVQAKTSKKSEKAKTGLKERGSEDDGVEENRNAASKRKRNTAKEKTKKKKEVTRVDQDQTDTSDAPKAEKSTQENPIEESSSLSDIDDDASKIENLEKTETASVVGAASESELSELIDEEPKPKRRKKAASDGKESKQKTEPKKRGRKAAEKKELDPDAEEIKTLQGWLVKCGIRKMWARELKPYETPKEKIRHLKGMLSVAGMSGRYSIQKATQIREARELAADLEAVQDGEKRWGKSEAEEEEEEEELPRRRRPTNPLIDEIDYASD